jgi:hypothetical protein
MSAVMADTHPAERAEMTTCRKCLLGGLGALTPIILNLAVVDIQTTLTNLTLLVGVGYLIRVVILFYVGGLWVYLHKDEKSPLKVFELGVVAPALIIAAMNGANASQARTHFAAGPGPAAALSAVTGFFIPTAYARGSDPEVKKFSPPKESVTEQLWRGISGSRSERVWFLIAGSSRDLRAAREQARRINRETPDFKAEVYEDGDSYAVVIGPANLTLDEAKNLKQKALDAKVPAASELHLFNPWAPK